MKGRVIHGLLSQSWEAIPDEVEQVAGKRFANEAERQ